MGTKVLAVASATARRMGLFVFAWAHAPFNMAISLQAKVSAAIHSSLELLWSILEVYVHMQKLAIAP